MLAQIFRNSGIKANIFTMASMWILALAFMLLFVPLASQGGGGSLVGNGGGLAEQNLLFAWKTLPQVIENCAEIPTCTKNGAYRTYLKGELEKYKFVSPKTEFVFGNFPGQSDAIVVLGETVRSDSLRLYPEGKALNYTQALKALLVSWTTPISGEAAASNRKSIIENLVLFSLGAVNEWGLTQYNYAEVRVIEYSGHYFFQDHYVTFDMSEALRSINDQLDCSAPLIVEISNIFPRGIKGEHASKEFDYFIESAIRYQCDSRNFEKTLHWKLPLEIENGHFYDLKALKPKLVLKLKTAKIKFLVQ